MEKPLKATFAFLRRFFWGLEDFINSQTKISFLSISSSSTAMILTKGTSFQTYLAYAILVDCLRRSFGLDSCPIEVDYSRAECKDFLIKVTGYHPSFITYDYYIKRFDGFIMNLDQTKLSTQVQSSLEYLLNFLQVDDSRYFDDVEEAKGSYHRPILFVYLMKNGKRYPKVEELTKQVEELIEKTKFDPNQFHITFLYETVFVGEEQVEKLSKQNDEEFYSAIEWLFSKCAMK